ncbi:MAG TPA: MMPL family transporter [Aliidongia sp.]|nr:MMPL family transporter [Aliidongia sp.]
MTKRRLAVMLWLLALALSVGIILRTPFTTDMSAFLPSAPEPAQQILVDQLKDGVASRLLLVGIEGGTQTARAGISRAVAGALRGNADFALIDNGDGGIGKEDQRFVWRNRYLLSPAVTPERFSAAGLRQALQQDVELLSSGLEPLVKGSIGADPTGETLSLARSLAGETSRTIRDGVWAAPGGDRALILAQTRAPGIDIDAQERAITAIRQAFAEAREKIADGAGAKLLITGPGLFGVETRAQMKHDVSLYSAIATLAIVGLLLGLYRSPVALGLTLVPVVTGALAGIAAVSLWFGFVHGITIGFGVTLIGEAVDYAIYLLAQTSAQSGPEATMARIWPTLRLGVLVSISGFAAMLFSSFTGFAQLGIFTIVGLATALCVTRFVLPSLLPVGFAGTRAARFAPGLLRLVHRAGRLRPALYLLTAAALVLVVIRSDSLWEDDLSSMSPIPASAQQLDRELRHDIGAPDVRYLAIASAPTTEAALRASEQAGVLLDGLIPSGALKSYDAPGRYLPSVATQRRRQEALPDPDLLAQNLRSSLDGLPFWQESFAPFLADIAAAKAAMPLTRRSLDDTALSLKLDSLLIEQPGRTVAILPLHDVADAQRIADALAGAQGIQLLDLKAQSDRLLHRYRQEALLLSALGSAAIALLLLAHFRSVAQTATVLAPLAVAVVMTLALLTLHGQKLSIFNLFGLLLVIAVGSNYCLFFQRRALAGPAGERTVTSLLLANLCTVIGFGALSLSGIPVLFGIGSTVAVGTAISLVAAAIMTRELDRPACAK